MGISFIGLHTVRCSYGSALVAVALVLGQFLHAQAQTPVTDLFIVQLVEEVGVTVFGAPKRISVHNGYNNQPAFTRNGKSILFNADPSGNTDIFRYDIENDTTYQVTKTVVGEYSPTPISDFLFVSVVVEPDGRQRLWEYNIFTGLSQIYVSERDSVGYFDILDDGQIPMFVLGSPQSLRIWDPSTKTERRVEGTPGRSIRKHPNLDGFVFIDTTRPDRNLVVDVDPVTLSRNAIAQMPEGALDLVFGPDGTLYASSGSIIYAYSSEADGIWKSVADFRNFGLSNISRMAVSPDGRTFALVSVYTPVPPLDEEPRDDRP
jgi:WD40 repeat protein